MNKPQLMNPQFNQVTSGTLTGTALALLVQITNAEMLKTMALAAIGATVSFLVSCIIRQIQKWMHRRPLKSK